MEIYFTASSRGDKKNKIKYQSVLKSIKELGHTNTNYVHFDRESKEYKVAEKELSKTNVYDYQTKLISKSDVLIADITDPTITIGYQIDYAINKKIPIIVLYQKNSDFKLPVVLTHSHFGLVTIKEYDKVEEIKEILKICLEDVKVGSIKFNFYINLQIHNYITRRAEENKSKSDIIREIIESEVNKNPI